MNVQKVESLYVISMSPAVQERVYWSMTAMAHSCPLINLYFLSGRCVGTVVGKSSDHP